LPQTQQLLQQQLSHPQQPQQVPQSLLQKEIEIINTSVIPPSAKLRHISSNLHDGVRLWKAIYCDGSGSGAAGVAFSGDHGTEEWGAFLPGLTNNQAEFVALCAAINISKDIITDCFAHGSEVGLVIILDSDLVTSALLGEKLIRSHNLTSLFHLAKHLLDSLPADIRANIALAWMPGHGEFSQLADSTCNRVLTSRCDLADQSPFASAKLLCPVASTTSSSSESQPSDRDARIISSLSDLRVARKSLRRNDAIKFTAAVAPLFARYNNAPPHLRDEILWEILDAPKRYALAGEGKKKSRKLPVLSVQDPLFSSNVEAPPSSNVDDLNFKKRKFKKVTELARGGAFSRAVKLLLSASSPDSSFDTGDKLEALHPTGDLNLQPSKPPHSANLLSPDPDELIKLIKENCDMKSGGPSGWTEELFLLVVRHNAQSLEGSTQVLVDIANGDIGEEVAARLAASRLVGLMKPDFGVRPIAIGECFSRLAGKLLLSKVNSRLNFKFGNAGQFAFAPGGVEAIVHSTRSSLYCGKSFVTVDCSNAFNSINRHVFLAELYSDPSLQLLFNYVDLFYGGKSALIFAQSEQSSSDPKTSERILKPRFIWSREGVRQGCVLGPALFCLGIHPVLEKIRVAHPLIHIVAYMDDIIVLGDSDEAIIAATLMLSHELHKIGLHANHKKCFASGPHASTLANSLGFNCMSAGQKVLGAWISHSPSDSEEFLYKKLAKHNSFFESVVELPSPVALPILKACGLPRWNHIIRCHEPHISANATASFDDHVLQAFTKISCGDMKLPSLSPLQRILVHLPRGGVGLTNMSAIASLAYQSSLDPSSGTQHAKSDVFNSHLINEVMLHPDFSKHLHATMKRGAGAWLSCVDDIDEMTPAAFSAALRNLILWSAIEPDAPVSCECGFSCSGAQFGPHVQGCVKIPGSLVSTRHNAVRDKLCDLSRDVSLPVMKERLIYKRGTEERRIDLSIWIQGVIYFIDITITSTTAASHIDQNDAQILNEKTRLKEKLYGEDASRFSAELIVFQLDVLGGISTPAFTMMKKIASAAPPLLQDDFFRSIVRSLSATIQAFNGEILLRSCYSLLASARTNALVRSFSGSDSERWQHQPYALSSPLVNINSAPKVLSSPIIVNSAEKSVCVTPVASSPLPDSNETAVCDHLPDIGFQRLSPLASAHPIVTHCDPAAPSIISHQNPIQNKNPNDRLFHSDIISYFMNPKLSNFGAINNFTITGH